MRDAIDHKKDIDEIGMMARMLDRKLVEAIGARMMLSNGWKLYLEYCAADALIMTIRALAESEINCLDYHVHEKSLELVYVHRGEARVLLRRGDKTEEVVLTPDGVRHFVIPEQVNHSLCTNVPGTMLHLVLIPADKAMAALMME